LKQRWEIFTLSRINRNITIEPVKPPDCALTIGIPLTEQDFLSDLASDSFDYAANIRRRYNLTEIGAWRQFEKTASYIRQVCDKVEKNGVTVIRRATLSDVASLFKNHKVVTLTTHSVWHSFQEGELIHPEALIEAIKTREGSVPEALRIELADFLGPNGSFSTKQNLLGELVRALEPITRRAHGWFEEGTHRVEEMNFDGDDTMPPRHLTRPMLEMTFPDLLVAGRAIELRDGLHTLPNLISSVPKPFTGFLDLTICNSAILSPAIKQVRPNCLTVINRAPANPTFRFMRYQLVVKSLLRCPAPFGEVLAQVHSILAERRLHL
jgi:hypothetical protein